MAISTATAVTNAATTLGNLILVTPQSVVGYQPQNTQGSTYTAPAIVFHYEGEQTATIESDITDHYVEDNTAIQDQIALKPVIITTQGFIGELNDIPPNQFFAAAQTAASKLTVIGAYTPSLSITALLAYNEAVFAYQTASNLANSAVNSWNSITGNASSGTSVITGENVTAEPNQNKQQQYFQQFYGYWTSRTLFTVQTPWAIFTDMAIERLKAVQDDKTQIISDFEVTFKQIRFATVLSSGTLYSTPGDFETRGSNQVLSGNTILGTNQGTSALNPNPTPVSFNGNVA